MSRVKPEPDAMRPSEVAPFPAAEPTYSVVWPLGRAAADFETLPARLPDLNGKVVAEIWDYAYKGDVAFPIIRAELEKLYPGVTFVDFSVFGNIHGGGDHKTLGRLPGLLKEHKVDAAIVGVGHCGSCTPACIRAALAVEREGVPSVTIVGSGFETLARHASEFFQIEGYPLAVYPGRVPMDDDATFHDKIAGPVTAEVIEGLTRRQPRLTAPVSTPAPREVVMRGTIDEINETFYRRGWTDGMPVLPPTVERVERFLAHTTRDPGEVLGVLPPHEREATVWNVAVNGVMAGCAPEYMPVLLAVVEAIADPAFKIGDSASGPGWEPMITISGPIIKKLDFNYGTGAMRVGRQANTSVGRFLRLYMRNIAGLRPGETDKGAIGSTFHVVLAEDEDAVRALGWPTNGDDIGVPPGKSAVSVQSIMGASAPYGEHGGPSDDPYTYLHTLVEFYGKGLLGSWLWLGLSWARWYPIVVLSQHAAKILAANGWTKDKVRQYLFDEARVPARYTLKAGKYNNLDIPRKVAKGTLPAVFAESDDPDRLIPVFIRPELTRIVVAGNPDMYYQRGFISHVAGAPVTRVIED